MIVFLFSCSGSFFDAMLTWEDYKGRSRHYDYSPYIVELSSASGHLVYFGAFHTVDEYDSQFRELEHLWEKTKPDLALSEGHVWPVEASRRESVRKYGEQGLLAYLADRDDIPVKTIDPSRLTQAHFLSLRFRPMQIKMYFILLQGVINRRMGWENSPESANRILFELRKMGFLRGRPFNYSEFYFLFKSIFPEIGDWRNIPQEYFHNKKKGKFIAKIHKAVSRFRNEYMLERVIKEIKKGNRVFAVVGRSHVVIQEPFLKKALQ